jgi:tetratricopeptide (TPR) repeat protein
MVLNAAIVHPASRTLWHSTTMQPEAPFGEYVGFTLGKGSAPPSIPASALLAGEAMARERIAIALGREALHALAEQRPADARKGLETLLAANPPVLEPARLGLGLALARFQEGDVAGAAHALVPVTAADVPIDVQIYGLSLRALCADRLGHRDEAVALYRETLTLIEAHPEWNQFEKVAAWAREGTQHSLADREPVVSLYALRLPL